MTLRRSLARVAQLVGRRSDPIDLRGSKIDPFEALRQHKARGVVVDIPLERCRTFGALGFPPTVLAGHPYVLAAADHLAGRIAAYTGSVLETYYETVQPRTAAALLGLPEDAAGTLGRMEAIEAELPWINVSGARVKNLRATFMESDSAEFDRPMGLEHGWSFIGPVSVEKGELELHRTRDIVDAIAREGYQVTSPADHVWGYLLRAGEEYAALIWGGQHRVSALAALGYESIPLLLRPHRVAHRLHAEAWPAVTSGSLDRDQALQVFDRLMAGLPPREVEAIWPKAWRDRTSLAAGHDRNRAGDD